MKTSLADLRVAARVLTKSPGFTITTVAALAVGIALSVAATRVFLRAPAGVSPLDPLAFAGAVPVPAAAATPACYLPARYATRIDPVHALRAD